MWPDAFALVPMFDMGSHLLTKLNFVHLPSATPPPSQIICRLAYFRGYIAQQIDERLKKPQNDVSN